MGAVTGKRMIAYVVCGVLVLSLVSMAVQGWLSHRPVSVGLVDGKLRACPSSPNCVSSDAPPGKQFVRPLSQPGGDATSLAAVRRAIEATPRTRIISATEGYLHAEFESLIFRFVDDVEIQRRPAENVLRVRSASRVGYWDLGTNRRRVERLRRLLEQRASH